MLLLLRLRRDLIVHHSDGHLIWWTQIDQERGGISSSFVLASFGFTALAQMLVTDYGYGWYRLAQL